MWTLPLLTDLCLASRYQYTTVRDPKNHTLHFIYTDMPTKVPSLGREKSQEQQPDVSIRNIESTLLVKQQPKRRNYRIHLREIIIEWDETTEEDVSCFYLPEMIKRSWLKLNNRKFKRPWSAQIALCVLTANRNNITQLFSTPLILRRENMLSSGIIRM